MTSLSERRGFSSLSKSQIRSLESIRFKDGTGLLSTPTARFEVGCIITQFNLFLEENAPQFEEMVESLKLSAHKNTSFNEVLFGMSVFQDEQLEFSKLLSLLREGVKASVSAFKCRRCKEKKVSVFEWQGRSGDEEISRLLVCQACGEKWRIS